MIQMPTYHHTRADYQRALDGDDIDTLRAAYDRAALVTWDLRYKRDTRAAGREYLHRLTVRLADEIERQRPAGGVL
jgi:hypothetical protein